MTFDLGGSQSPATIRHPLLTDSLNRGLELTLTVASKRSGRKDKAGRVEGRSGPGGRRSCAPGSLTFHRKSPGGVRPSPRRGRPVQLLFVSDTLTVDIALLFLKRPGWKFTFP